MTAHEMILLWSPLQGVVICLPLCLVLGFASFAAFGKLGYPANFSWGPLVPGLL